MVFESIDRALQQLARVDSIDIDLRTLHLDIPGQSLFEVGF